jgi:hypothetical protein
MRFTTIAWRNPLRRPTRTLLTIAGGAAHGTLAAIGLTKCLSGFHVTSDLIQV